MAKKVVQAIKDKVAYEKESWRITAEAIRQEKAKEQKGGKS